LIDTPPFLTPRFRHEISRYADADASPLMPPPPYAAAAMPMLIFSLMPLLFSLMLIRR